MRRMLPKVLNDIKACVTEAHAEFDWEKTKMLSAYP